MIMLHHLKLRGALPQQKPTRKPSAAGLLHGHLRGARQEEMPFCLALLPEICPVGVLVKQLYPNETKTFVLRLAYEFSVKVTVG